MICMWSVYSVVTNISGDYQIRLDDMAPKCHFSLRTRFPLQSPNRNLILAARCLVYYYIPSSIL